MDFYTSIERAIDELKNNKYGIIIKKTKKNMLITTSIKFPKEILNKTISQISIEFLLIIDLYKPKFMPKLYCLSPYCYPHFADGRDIFRELPSSKNPKKVFNFSNILSEILEFIDANFQKGGLNFFGKYYLGSRYDLRMFQKSCSNKNIFNVKENLVLNGKSIKLNRILILSDVYFLMFEQEKWYKNNLMLIFWSSISNIQKIQKVKDNKTLILQWTQKESDNFAMSLTVIQRENFINIILEKMHQFGMAYDVQKFDNNKIIVDNVASKKKSKDMESQNKNLLDKNEQEENEDYNEEEEEEDDNEEEENNNQKNEGENVNNKKEEEKINNEESKEEDDFKPAEEEEKNENKEENGGAIPNIQQEINNEGIKNNKNEDKKEEVKKEEKKVESKNEEDKKEEMKEESKNDETKNEDKKDEIKDENKKEEKEEQKEEIKEKETEQKKGSEQK